MKILITGGGGFLGSHLARKLFERGDEVTVMGRKGYPELGESIKCVKGDIRDRPVAISALKEQEVVFHTAAIPGIWGGYEEFYRTDVEGTENIILACCENKVKKLIYTSSPSVVFGQSGMEDVDETTPYPDNYLCHYPKTKAMAEKLVMAANGSGGLATVCIRPHLIWGPGDPHLVPRLIDRAKKGRLVQVGDGKNKVDMIYIDNAVAAHIQACDKLDVGGPVGGKCYFVSDGKPVVLWDWINSLLKELKLPLVTRSISFKCATRIGRMLEIIYKVFGLKNEPPMTRFLAAQLAKSHFFNISRAKNDFSYRQVITPEEGMKRLITSHLFPPAN